MPTAWSFDPSANIQILKRWGELLFWTLHIQLSCATPCPQGRASITTRSCITQLIICWLAVWTAFLHTSEHGGAPTYGVVLVSKIKFDMHHTLVCILISSCADSPNWSAFWAASFADSANQSAFDQQFELTYLIYPALWFCFSIVWFQTLPLRLRKRKHETD